MSAAALDLPPADAGFGPSAASPCAAAAAPSASSSASGVPPGVSAARRSSRTALARHGSQAVLVQLPEHALAQSEPCDGDLKQPLSAASLPNLISQMGLGLFQLVALALLVGFPMSEGAQMLTSSCMARALQKQWHLTGFQTGSLASFSFLGLAVGTYGSGCLADVRGRRCAVLVSYFGMSSIGCLTCMATGYTSMSIMRFVSGVCCGLGVAASNSMLAEISPVESRPKLFVIFGAFYSLGEIYAALGFYVFMRDLEDPTHWRAVTTWAAIPATLSLIFGVALMQESAHWLTVTGRLGEARLVLEQMARMNRRPEVLAEFGPVTPTNSGGLTPTGGFSGTNDTSLWQVLGDIVGSYSYLRKVLLFGLLCVVGNLETFGMNYFWPSLLRTSGHHPGADGTWSPAGELIVLRATGLAANLITFLAVSVPWLSHRAAIASCGPLGALAMAGVLSGVPSILLPSGAVALTAGVMAYSVILIFLSESFPTQIRATAIGMAVTIGRSGSVAAPLLIARFGAGGFVRMAIAGFLFLAVGVLPLRETKGLELSDFAADEAVHSEEEARGADALGEALKRHSVGSKRGSAAVAGMKDEDPFHTHALVGAIPEERGPEAPPGAQPAVRLFAEGTVGARIELLLLAAMLGIVPMSATSFYFSSLGYFADKHNDQALFALQILAVVGASVPVMLLRWTWDPQCDRRLGVQLAMFLRVVLCSFLLGAAVLLTALVDTRAGLLAVGALVGAFGAVVLASGLELAATIDHAAVPWVQAGTAFGAALPVPAVAITTFKPGAALAVRLAFFSTPAAICAAGGLMYWWYHRQMVGLASFIEAFPEEATHRPRGSVDGLSGAYRRMESSLAAQVDTGSARQVLFGPEAGGLVGVASANVFGGVASTTFLVALLPSFGTPLEAQSLWLYKIAGDLCGRSVATALWRSGAVGAAPDAPRQEAPDGEAWCPPQNAMPCLAGLSALTVVRITCALLLALPVAIPKEATLQGIRLPAASEAMVWGLFGVCCLGSLIGSSLDALVPSAVPAPSRHLAIRWQTLISSLANLAGLLGAMTCYATSLSPATRALLALRAAGTGAATQSQAAATVLAPLAGTLVTAGGTPNLDALLSLAGPEQLPAGGRLLMRREAAAAASGDGALQLPGRAAAAARRSLAVAPQGLLARDE